MRVMGAGAAGNPSGDELEWFRSALLCLRDLMASQTRTKTLVRSAKKRIVKFFLGSHSEFAREWFLC